MAKKSSFTMPRGKKARGRVTRMDNRSVAAASPRGVRRVTATLAGQPGAVPLEAAPQEGKRGIRILSKIDPRLGGLFTADARTVSQMHTDIGTPGGYRGARVVAKSNEPVRSLRGLHKVKTPNIIKGLKKR